MFFYVFFMVFYLIPDPILLLLLLPWPHRMPSSCQNGHPRSQNGCIRLAEWQFWAPGVNDRIRFKNHRCFVKVAWKLTSSSQRVSTRIALRKKKKQTRKLNEPTTKWPAAWAKPRGSSHPRRGSRACKTVGASCTICKGRQAPPLPAAPQMSTRALKP